MMQSIASLGYEGFLRPTQFVHNVAEGGACFGVALKTKNPELRSQAISSGVGAILAGVSEPAIYGINLRLKKPMYGILCSWSLLFREAVRCLLIMGAQESLRWSQHLLFLSSQPKVCGKKIPSSCFRDWDWDWPFWIWYAGSEPISGDFWAKNYKKETNYEL